MMSPTRVGRFATSLRESVPLDKRGSPCSLSSAAAEGGPPERRVDLSWPRMMILTLAYASVADGQPIRAALRRLD